MPELDDNQIYFEFEQSMMQEFDESMFKTNYIETQMLNRYFHVHSNEQILKGKNI